MEDARKLLDGKFHEEDEEEEEEEIARPKPNLN